MTRVGTEKDYSSDSIPEEYLKTHIPEKVDYSLENILQDLLNFSADRLRVGGRLVYWIPIIRQVYKVHIEWEVLSTGFGTFLSFAPKKRSILPYKPA